MPHVGTTNQLYRGSCDGRPMVLRLNAEPGYAFGVDRRREAAIVAAIQGFPWAPQVLYNSPGQGWCLMADHGGLTDSTGLPDAGLPGEGLLGEGLPSEGLLGEGLPGEGLLDEELPDTRLPHSRAELLAAIGQWQQIDPGSVACRRLSYAELLQRYRDALGDAADPVWTELLNGFEVTVRALPAVSVCLTHHDLHPANLCFDKTRTSARWVVLDWEYAAIGNPWFDAAALVRQFHIPAEYIADLPAWSRLTPDEIDTGLRLGCWLSQVLECLWYTVRSRGQDMRAQAQHAQRLARSLPST